MTTPTGIVFGLDKELRPYLDRLAGSAIRKVAGLELIEGELAGKRVVLANAGIGKVNVSIAATSNAADGVSQKLYPSYRLNAE
jgi:nucleoside phosphorylase